MEVAKRLPRAARVRAEDLGAMVVSGHVWRLGEPADEAVRQAELTDRNMCALTNNFIDAGFTVLTDHLVTDQAGFDFDDYERLHDELTRELGEVGWWIDTSAWPAQETVDLVLREARQRASVG